MSIAIIFSLFAVLIPVFAGRFFMHIQIAAAIAWLILLCYFPMDIHEADIYMDRIFEAVIYIAIPWVLGSLIALARKVQTK